MVAFIGILIALSAFLLQPASPASAETTDDGQEVTDFYFAGVITFDDQPVAKAAPRQWQSGRR